MTASRTPIPRDDLESHPSAPSLFVRPEMIDPYERGDGVRTLPYVGSWNTVANHLSTGVTEVAPGASIRRHVHNVEETVYVVEGQGICHFGDESYEVAAGDASWIPAGIDHGFDNSGTEPLRLFWVYAGRDVTRTYIDGSGTETVG